MFAGALLNRLDKKQRAEVVADVEETLKPALYRDGVWMADYRRLRVVAVKPD